MSAEIILWFAGCLVFLLLILFVVRPYVLQNHEDEPETEQPKADVLTEPADEPERSVNPPS